MTDERRPARRRQAHPAQAARIAAAGLGSAATLGLVGVMASTGGGSAADTAPAPAPAAVAVTPSAPATASQTAPPVHLDVAPRATVVPSAGTRGLPDASSGGSR